MKSISTGIIRTYYCNIPNAGDQLTSLIVKQLFNKDVVLSRPWQCNLVGIGRILDGLFINPNPSMKERLKAPIKSILVHFNKYTPYVWSSGFMFKNGIRRTKTHYSDIIFSAVRGKLTKEHIEKVYRPIPNVVLADGGLLSSLLPPPEQKRTLCSMGIIPHWLELENIHIQKLLKQYKNAKLINMQNDPLTVINEISSCETILSSSLHGLIIADSFGIPNMPILVGSDIDSQKFKYEDYYSSYDFQYAPLDLLNVKEVTYPSINNIIDKYKIDYSAVQEKQKQLLECFPKELL